MSSFALSADLFGELLEGLCEGEGEVARALAGVADERVAVEGVRGGDRGGVFLHHDHGEHARVHQILHAIAEIKEGSEFYALLLHIYSGARGFF